MKRTIQVRITKGEHQYVAECLDLPVVTQAATLDELACGVNPPVGTCKGAQVTFIFTDGYATTSALTPSGSGQLVAGSQFPDPRAPSQVTSPNTVPGSGNMPCTPILNQFGMLNCLNPINTGISDGNPSEEGGQCSSVPGGCTSGG